MQGSLATQDEAGAGREVAAVHTAQEEAASCECRLENRAEDIWQIFSRARTCYGSVSSLTALWNMQPATVQCREVKLVSNETGKHINHAVNAIIEARSGMDVLLGSMPAVSPQRDLQLGGRPT